MEAQWNSIISATFLTSLLTRILEINFCKYCICSVYIAKSLSFFCCEAIFIISLRKLIVTSLPPTPLLFIGLLPWTGFTDPVYTSFYFIDCPRFILIPRWLPTKRCDTVPNHKVSWTVLSLNSLPFLLGRTVQDKTIWLGKKIFFPTCWQLQTQGRKVEKTCEKLIILIEKSKMLEE